jgi:hypothetical protein
MSGPVVTLDFAAQRLRITVAGAIVLMCGLLASTAAVFEYYSLNARRAGLELRLAALLRQSRPDSTVDAHNARMIDEASGIATELGTPWTALLADLELASHDSAGRVAILGIEPDHEKHRVRISGESKDLVEALQYLERLQSGSTLRFAMLDSHELVADDKEHPVRFSLTADWRGLP